jgi:hypothetical protein
MRRQVTTIFAVAGLALVPASAANAYSHSSDPRSPDARDAATLVVVPAGVITKAAPTTPSAHHGGNGFGWDDAGMIGGIALLGAAGVGAAYAFRPRRSRTHLAH